MSKRVTIIIDDKIDKELRIKQGKMIQTRKSSVSYSNVVNQILKKGLA